MGKRYVAVIEFFDADASDNAEQDIELMLKYGWKHGNHTASMLELKSADYYQLGDE